METLNKSLILQAVNSLKDLVVLMEEKELMNDKQADKLTTSLSDIYINLSKPLIVTVVGPFSSGKTTFINAIIKERILPESMAPCTGMVCKIGYCDSHLKIQYLKEGVKILESIKVEDLKKFVDINNVNYTRRDNRDILEIFHKNDFCENDILLVDTPGFNDPNFQDDATNNALDDADVVIYCMSAIHAYSTTDVERIKNLHLRKIDSIFYVIGYMDIVYLNDMNTGTKEMEMFKSLRIKELSSQTSLRENGIFFVCSTDELNKIAKRHYILKDNGIEEVRIKIWKYLQKNRLPIKIMNACNNLNKIDFQLEKELRCQLEEKEKILCECKKNIELSKKNREEAKMCIESISQICSTYEYDVYNFVKWQIESELLSISDNIEKWVDEACSYHSIFFITTGINNNSIRNIEDLIQKKCSEKIQRSIEERIIPYINTSTSKLQADITHRVEKYIFAVEINKHQTISSPTLLLEIENNALYPHLKPLPIAATVLMMEECVGAIMGLVFAPLLSIIALGLSIFQFKRKKAEIVLKIKEKIQSHSLMSQYVQTIIKSIRWREDVDPVISSLHYIVSECEKRKSELEDEYTLCVSEIRKIKEIDEKRMHLFDEINSLSYDKL